MESGENLKAEVSSSTPAFYQLRDSGQVTWPWQPPIQTAVARPYSSGAPGSPTSKTLQSKGQED